MKKRLTAHYGEYQRSLSEEGGRFYRGHHHNMDPVIKHVQKIRDMHQYADPRKDTPFQKHVGSVSPAMLMDWLNKSGHTLHEWAVNAGGDPYNKRKGGPGVYDKFLTFFLSREFSKLHNDHVTTKPESSSIVVPNYIGGKRENKSNAGDSDTAVAEPGDG